VIRRGAPQSDGVQQVVIARDRLMLVLPSNHPKAAAEKVALGEVAGDRFILFSNENSMTLYGQITELWKRTNLVPRITHKAENAFSILALVAAGCSSSGSAAKGSSGTAAASGDKSATVKIEQSTKIKLSPASEEQDVLSVLSKVEAKVADAGLVYVTDARRAGGKVQEVDFPEAKAAVNTYPIAVINNSPHAQLAQAFVAFVHSPAVRQQLAAAGFGPA